MCRCRRLRQAERMCVFLSTISYVYEHLLIECSTGYSQCQPGSATTATSSVTTSTTAVTQTPAPTTTPPLPAGPIVVLPLGDSITLGQGAPDGNSYRKELKDSLERDGVTIDYIGSIKNGNMQDNENEGRAGQRIDQISGYAAAPLAQKPQVSALRRIPVLWADGLEYR